MMRVLIMLVGIVALAGPARADHTFLKESDAPRAMFPGAATAERRTLAISDGDREALGKTLGRKIEAKQYPYLDVRDEHGAALGVIFLLDVIGQSQPITFAVAIAADGTLRDIQVLVYRESHGDEIQDRRFRRQFAGKRAGDPIALGKDIDAVSGATISSRSATFAARKALLLAGILRGSKP